MINIYLVTFMIFLASCQKLSRVYSFHSGGAISSDQMKILAIKPVVAKPGQTVTVTGVNLTQQAMLRVGDQSINWLTASGDTATFVMPQTSRPGAFEIKVGRYNDPNGHVDAAAKYIVADSAGDDIPIFMASTDEICEPTQFRDEFGVLQTGTRDCGVLRECVMDGQIDCVASSTLKAADVSGFSSVDLVSGKTMAGVVGTGVLGPDFCRDDGGTGCVSTARYKSANMANVTAGNIKAGMTIAGVVGVYPNATYPLPGASATVDLAPATFNAQMKSSAVFEYWDSSGSRHTGAGDTNIVGSNLAASATIFGTSGILTTPDPWNLRAGTVLVRPTGNVTGRLQMNCRNTSNPNLYDIKSMPAIGVSGPAASSSFWTINDGVSSVANDDKLQLIATSPPTPFVNGNSYFVVNSSGSTFELAASAQGTPITATAAGTGDLALLKVQGATIDIWDTIDDHNNNTAGLPTQLVGGWSETSQCGGIELTSGDSKIWQDVTTTGDGVTPSTCQVTSTSCSYRDKISGLEWSKKESGLSKTWSDAIAYCETLAHNGKSDWRLPTQKEAMAAYEHGFRSTASIYYFTTFSTTFWTSSNHSIGNTAWTINLAQGLIKQFSKHTPYSPICVR